MAERIIEMGGLKIHLSAEEDAVSLVQALMRHVSNQEVADMLGVSERTVRRWKREGRLPDRGNERLRLADLVAHLIGGAAHESLARAGEPPAGHPPARVASSP